MATYPEYLAFNPCTVVINGKYTITNIQTAGFPGDNCGAHLESISIKSSAVGSNNPQDYGASGTITVIDYKNAVFNVLRERMVDFLKSNKNNTHLSTVSIHIDSFTGPRDWFGWVLNWNYAFVGTTPSINLEWTAIPPAGSVDTDRFYNNGEYTKPIDLINDLKKAHPTVSGDIPIVDASGADISGKLQFTTDKVNFNLSNLPAGCSPLITGYDFITQTCTIDGKALSRGTIETDSSGKSKYVVKYAEVTNNTASTEEGKVTSGIIFVQNGSYKYYSNRDDGKCVIPMASFNFTTDMSKMVLQSRVLYNANGNIVQNAANGSNSTETPEASSSNNKRVEAGTGASGVIVTFDCYNVLSFSMNNINEQVHYEVYDEFGNQHVVTGNGTVTEVSYNLKNGVVQASVTAAEYYNQADTSGTGNSSPPNVTNPSGNSSPPNVTNPSGNNSDSDYITAADEEKLISEDVISLELQLDQTLNLVKSGEFTKCVSEFFDRGYGELTGENRLLDWDYIDNLIVMGNFGLFTLLIAVANYGIKNCPLNDYAINFSMYAGKKPFFASNIGKNPMDFSAGGLGLPHWDADNYGDIYQNIGFDKSISSDKNFKSILTTENTNYDGKVIGWKEGKFCGEDRLFPEISGKKCYWTRFDKGLKSNSIWLKWAENILTHNGPSGRIYQDYLIKLWVTKFWEPTIKALTPYNVEISTPEGHYIATLQDAVRIARMGNSSASLIKKAAGKFTKDQFKLYLEHYSKNPGHAIRQWIFCCRATYILSQLADLI